ncbi:MAG: transcription antitermination factor NusB [Candidatus Symbiodolus clandestinus]
MEPLTPSRKMQARQMARYLALQAIYAWQLSENSLPQLMEYFLQEPETQEVDQAYFNQLVAGVIEHHVNLDQQLQPYVLRSLQGLDPVEKALLRLALYELLYCPKVPYKVVINEAIELAKDFGAQDSHKFVNGVLDKLKTKA